MVKTLRRKFIAITMISVTAVFLIIMGIINIVNYSNVYSNAKARMDILAENNGEFPKIDQPQQTSDPMMKPEGMDLSQNNKNSNPQNNFAGQKKDKRDNFNGFS